jgi:hypothetical protein
MSTLSDDIKAFIVKGLACFDTPSQVAESVKVTFGLEVSRQQVYAYDPDCTQPPSARWIALHAATREKFLDGMAEITVAHKAVRLRMLERYARLAEDQKRTQVAAMFLEQAAKECGGVYEGRKAPAAPKNAAS